MKQIKGIWLPDDDTHFEGHLEKGPEFNGKGTYQFNKIELALAATPAKRRGLFVDVGAHVGLWSRVMAASFEWVQAFEPVYELAKCWDANITQAGITNAQLVSKAVSNDCCGIDMHLEWSNTGNCRVMPHHGTYTIDTTTLDAFDFGRRIDLVKVDVEGWEQRVIEGGVEIIKQDRPVIVVEQKPGHAERYGMARYGAVIALQGLGMQVEWERAGDVCLTWPS